MSFYEPQTQKGLFGNIVLWVIGILVLSAVIGVAVWGFGVVTADPKGKGNAYKQQRSANNRVFAQQNFEQLNADIEGYVGKIDVAKAAYQSDPSDINQTNLTGVKQICIDAVQQYNADSRKYLLKDFKAADLPPRHEMEECK